MEYFDFLPIKYRDAFDELHEKILNAQDPETVIKLYEDFSKIFTLVAHAWQRRIGLETAPFPPESLPLEVFKECLKARIKAFKQFYHPRYIEARFLTDRQEKQALKNFPEIGQIYRLPFCKNLWIFCEALMKKTHERYAFEFLKNYLIFPHDQLYRFYRFYQIHSARRTLDPSIKKQYDDAVKSYNYMITIALDSEEWLKWMKETFEEKDWILNLECKISEHFFMKEIWFFYIEYLDSQNKITVLDVYKRYCRLFIEDKDMQQQYSEAIKKYDENFHVFRWQCDQEEFQWDFETKENGCPKLRQLLEKAQHCICEECFTEKNAKYFGNKIKCKNSSSSKRSGLLSKFFKKKKKKCDTGKIENCLLCYDLLDKSIELIDGEDSDDDDGTKADKRCKEYQKAINFQPIVKINFKSIFEPPKGRPPIPLPKPLFQYIVENANEKVLSKLYECSKYFFVKRRYLMCGSVYISKCPEEFYLIRNLYYSNVESLAKLQVKKVCSGTSFVFCNKILRSSLSPLIPKLCFCALENLALFNQDMSTAEFDLIISGGKLEQIELDKTTIINEDESHLTIEDLIEKLPNIAVFSLSPISPNMFTTSTTEKLSKLVRTTKFEHFEIWNIPNTFELAPFVKFMELYMVPRAKMELRLHPDIDDAYDEMFSQFRHLVRTKWNPFYAAPQIN